MKITELCEGSKVTYVISLACVDVVDRAWVDVCPVDCIYEGERMLYIQPTECIDCAACEPVCPVMAIYYEDDVPADEVRFIGENESFFNEPLPGKATSLGSPGGASRSGLVGVDTAWVASLPPNPRRFGLEST